MHFNIKGALIALSCFFILNPCFAQDNSINEEYKTYCEATGGTVESMPASYGTRSGTVQGDSKDFCTFHIDNGFIAIGLATFASDKPSLGATLIKQLPELSSSSPLFKGAYSNPSLNVCKNLGGASIGFIASSGGFVNKLGESDICVFGDGSMVSGWSLIYMANHRTGYDFVKEKVKAQPLNITIPSKGRGAKL